MLMMMTLSSNSSMFIVTRPLNVLNVVVDNPTDLFVDRVKTLSSRLRLRYQMVLMYPVGDSGQTLTSLLRLYAALLSVRQTGADAGNEATVAGNPGGFIVAATKGAFIDTIAEDFVGQLNALETDGNPGAQLMLLLKQVALMLVVRVLLLRVRLVLTVQQYSQLHSVVTNVSLRMLTKTLAAQLCGVLVVPLLRLR